MCMIPLKECGEIEVKAKTRRLGLDEKILVLKYPYDYKNLLNLLLEDSLKGISVKSKVNLDGKETGENVVEVSNMTILLAYRFLKILTFTFNYLEKYHRSIPLVYKRRLFFNSKIFTREGRDFNLTPKK